jgi:hypothetical protein
MTTDPDPMLSPREMWQDANISKATWVRHYRPKLEQLGLLIWLSPRRCGTRRSKWRALLDSQTQKAA